MNKNHRCYGDARCHPFRSLGPKWFETTDCAVQAAWNKKMARLLAKEPKPMTGFSFMPKREVT